VFIGETNIKSTESFTAYLVETFWVLVNTYISKFKTKYTKLNTSFVILVLNNLAGLTLNTASKF